MPSVYLSDDPREELIAYVNTYLQEEIQSEAAVRKLQSFYRFLQMSAFMSGKMLNFSNLANDLAIPASTIREHYQILQDTLIGFLLPAWTKTQKRKAISTAKFYFFDIGVRHQLANIKTIEPHSDLYGQAFEHFIAMELRAYISYTRKHIEMSYWASKNGHEVDFIVGDTLAIEVKATQMVSTKHLKNLKILPEKNICKHYCLVTFNTIHRASKGIEIIYWENFLNKLWNGQYDDLF